MAPGAMGRLFAGVAGVAPFAAPQGEPRQGGFNDFQGLQPDRRPLSRRCDPWGLKAVDRSAARGRPRADPRDGLWGPLDRGLCPPGWRPEHVPARPDRG